MKNSKLALCIIAYMASLFSGKAQIILESGNIAGLKGVTKVNIVYDYSKMAVGEFATEQEYLDKKASDYAGDPEKAEKFIQDWFGSRKSRYEPKFEELFNKFAARVEMFGENNSKDGPVTLKVITTYTEPGFHAFVVRRPAAVSFKCIFITREGKEIVSFVLNYVPGKQASGYDFDSGSRIAESYAKAAKVLMKEVAKRLKKLE